MAQIEKQFDPTGAPGGTANAVLAPRPGDLQGLTLGLLDNTKPNASVILHEIGDVLTKEHGIEAVNVYAKHYFGTPLAEELRDQIVAECDVVVAAVGDCGSCSAGTVADGVILERAGKPAVSICTDAFSPTGRAMAEVQGLPAFEFATVKHPVASLDLERIRKRVREAIPQILKILRVER